MWSGRGEGAGFRVEEGPGARRVAVTGPSGKKIRVSRSSRASPGRDAGPARSLSQKKTRKGRGSRMCPAGAGLTITGYSAVHGSEPEKTGQDPVAFPCEARRDFPDLTFNQQL